MAGADSLRDTGPSQRPQRTTILVPVGTNVPATGACSRTVPLPLICTVTPAAAVNSIAWRTGNPKSDGTLSFLPSLIVTCVDAYWGGGLAVSFSSWVDAVGFAATEFDCASEAAGSNADTTATCAGAAGWRSGSSAGRSLTAANSAFT